ncbi:unnamed protein product [Commensalibacter communis]|uniref:DUF4145 domain-containing protein n=1 Tax=Commensalibacter communis TaxID=2972786 RepID=A0A9W4TM35_9PROT|nr:DUF4145 domain-containing protein [Commensalibacter communis]CAI3926912.1 unnamed protein product [Commensalibacter communis]CAI3928446.1 unnamed protein product [Commensalibacter communis]CAI3934063.1 unnamed protein product [Commensalibacter communis]CAI3934576.1 unnamed protein product [Commensalibacter communis]
MVVSVNGQDRWTCPYCNYLNSLGDNCKIISGVFDEHTNSFTGNPSDIIYNKHQDQLNLKTAFIVCLNPECREYIFMFSLSLHNSSDFIHKWDSLPEGLNTAKIFPDYIPKAILEDYKEACLIKDKSPKASATLSRRCLQGIIRDFWKVKPDTLYKEINQIKDKIGSDLYDAIDAIRQIWNIGAHMEKDINVIIDVDPNEAQILIELIEMLIEEWYIKDHERKERLARITAIGVEKKALKGSK